MTHSSDPDNLLDFDLYIDDLRHDTPTDHASQSVASPFQPLFSVTEATHLYQIKLPIPLWRYLKKTFGRGNIAPFVRDAIYEKLTAHHPNLPQLLAAVKAILPIIEELFLTADVSRDFGQAEYIALQEALEEFDK